MQTTLVEKRFDLQVAASGATVSETFQLEKNVLTIKGIAFEADKPELAYYRGSQRIEINKKEIFPDNYETKRLMAGINVDLNKRIRVLRNIKPGNGKVKVDYKDTDDGRTPFAAYRVSMYLYYEIEDLD